MADRQDSDREVLTSLPRSRPVRRSAKRADRPDAEDGATVPARKAASSQASSSKAKAAGKTKADSKASAGSKGRAGSSGTTRARPPRKAATRTAGSTPGAKPAQQPRVGQQRNVPPAGYAVPSSREQAPASGAAELVGTTIQAAAELTQIGLTIGRQTLRSMLDRLPKP